MNNPDLAMLDFFEVGDKTALVCADSYTSEETRRTLKDMGYKSHVAETVEIAIERLRYTMYNVVIIQETFAGSSLSSNSLLNYLTALPMAQRRNSLVCLIGRSFKTLDAMQAFWQSVHVVVHPSDLPNFTAILKKSCAEFELLYKVYNNAVAAQSSR
jgi:ActR/RegA family two-component response regulator